MPRVPPPLVMVVVGGTLVSLSSRMLPPTGAVLGRSRPQKPSGFHPYGTPLSPEPEWVPVASAGEAAGSAMESLIARSAAEAERERTPKDCAARIGAVRSRYGSTVVPAEGTAAVGYLSVHIHSVRDEAASCYGEDGGTGLAHLGEVDVRGPDGRCGVAAVHGPLSPGTASTPDGAAWVGRRVDRSLCSASEEEGRLRLVAADCDGCRHPTRKGPIRVTDGDRATSWRADVAGPLLLRVDPPGSFDWWSLRTADSDRWRDPVRWVLEGVAEGGGGGVWGGEFVELHRADAAGVPTDRGACAEGWAVPGGRAQRWRLLRLTVLGRRGDTSSAAGVEVADVFFGPRPAAKISGWLALVQLAAPCRVVSVRFRAPADCPEADPAEVTVEASASLRDGWRQLLPRVELPRQDRLSWSSRLFTSSRITRRLWQTARRLPLPPDAARYAAGWRDATPGWEHYLYAGEDGAETCAAAGCGEAWAKLSRVGVMKADLWRYAALWLSGGVYADVDTELLLPPAEWWFLRHPAVDLVVGLEPEETGVRHACQWFIAARPGHPLLRTAIDMASERIAAGVGYTDRDAVHIATAFRVVGAAPAR
eukprot:TRINITY_DN20545_c0_g1_i1.p1 TRINITY_DN20545_c0_g1~~TRINITY_DN20545_c0_g1_i1.p1  ORF type:complete len:592 (+),score=173.40 TRINITY_DN20545_c0_g1_i1:53-1828(+)